MKYILLLLIHLFLGNTNFSNSQVYELDWMMNEALRQVHFDRKSYNSIAGNDFLMVFWATGNEQFLKMTPLLNELAKSSKGKYKLLAYNPSDDYATIKRFKRQLNKDFISPRKDIEAFLANYTFIVDLDKKLPTGLYEADTTNVVLVENGKVKKILKNSQEIKKFIQEKSKAPTQTK